MPTFLQICHLWKKKCWTLLRHTNYKRREIVGKEMKNDVTNTKVRNEFVKWLQTPLIFFPTPQHLIILNFYSVIQKSDKDASKKKKDKKCFETYLQLEAWRSCFWPILLDSSQRTSKLRHLVLSSRA